VHCGPRGVLAAMNDFNTSDFAPPGRYGVSFLINPRSLLSCPCSIIRGRRRAEASGTNITRCGTLTRRSSTTHTHNLTVAKVVRDRVGEDKVCVYYCRTYYKAVCGGGGGDSERHVRTGTRDRVCVCMRACSRSIVCQCMHIRAIIGMITVGPFWYPILSVVGMRAHTKKHG
jgi:hypothetical protein